MGRASDAAPRQTARDIDPVVEPERWMTDAQLRAPGGGESGEPYGALLGSAVTVCVFEIQNVGRAGHDQPAAPWHDAVGKGQFCGKISAVVVAAAAIGVAQSCDAAHWRLTGRRTRRIPAIFGDV